LPKWERIEELIKEASFAIGMRAGDDTDEIEAIISRLEGTYGVSVKYTCICAPGADIASSQIRSGMLDELKLHPTMYEYMQQHGLYTAKDFIQDA
jgi:nicotinic acid mononucleotide adenylyltransferase